jgi:hypothetical protein
MATKKLWGIGSSALTPKMLLFTFNKKFDRFSVELLVILRCRK